MNIPKQIHYNKLQNYFYLKNKQQRLFKGSHSKKKTIYEKYKLIKELLDSLEKTESFVENKTDNLPQEISNLELILKNTIGGFLTENEFKFHCLLIKKQIKCELSGSIKTPKYKKFVTNCHSRQIKCLLSQIEFENLIKSDCFICKKGPNNTIDRFNCNKPFEIKNCFTVCRVCKFLKKELTLKDFFYLINSLSFDKWKTLNG